MKIFITGGTGFIGGHLVRALVERGDTVVVATRSPEKKGDSPSVRFVSLEDGLAGHLEGCDVVVNLAGESLFGKRWTAPVKKRLRESRIRTTRSLVDAMGRLDNKPALFISASAVGYYGDRGSDKVTEKHPAGGDFLAELCREWEQAAVEAEKYGIRVVNPRIGVALGREGGALATMLPVFRSFVGGSIGAGTQYFPWIHVDDLCRSFLFAMDNSAISGPFNASAPNPVTMDEFAKSLGSTISRPSLFRVPEFGLNLVLGEAAIMITTSLRVIPEKILGEGFRFRFEHVEHALEDILAG